MRGDLENPDLAWALIFIEARLHKYPKLRYVAGAFKGNEWKLEVWYFAPDQTAFLNKGEKDGIDTIWSVDSRPETAILNPIPWRLHKEFSTASKVEIRVVRPLKVCRFCNSELFTGICESGDSLWYKIPEMLRINQLGNAWFEYRNRRVEDVRKAVDDFVMPLSSSEPIVFGVCRYCVANPDERTRRDRGRRSDFCNEKRRGVFDLQYRGGLKIARRFHSCRKISRLRAMWDLHCESEVGSGFAAAQKLWREKHHKKLTRLHVKRRKNNQINFFAMVDAVSKLSKIQNQH
jgi:hypothetical protein